MLVPNFSIVKLARKASCTNDGDLLAGRSISRKEMLKTAKSPKVNKSAIGCLGYSVLIATEKKK